MSDHTKKLIFLLIVGLLALSFVAPVVAQGGEQWCAGKHIRFFVGGAEGDAFASIVLRGAEAADADLGPAPVRASRREAVRDQKKPSAFGL